MDENWGPPMDFGNLQRFPKPEISTEKMAPLMVPNGDVNG